MKTQYSILLASALSLASSANAETLLTDKFDEQSISGWQPSGNNTAMFVNSTARGGNYAAELKLDRLLDKVSYRTELSLQNPKFDIGKEYWIGFSNQIPSAGSGRFLAMQIHKRKDPGDSDSGKQPMVLNAGLSGWRINVNFDANANTTSSTEGAKSFSAGSLSTDQWIDWVIHVDFSYQSDGLLEIWKNGSKIVNYQGPNCYNDALGPYLKAGIYIPGWRSRAGATESDIRTIYYDEVTVGDAAAGYAGVAP